MTLIADIMRDSHLTVGEAAALLGAHPITVRHWIGSGRLESTLVEGRRWVPKRAIAAYYAALLANPDTRAATIERLRAIAEHAGVEFNPEALLADSMPGESAEHTLAARI